MQRIEYTHLKGNVHVSAWVERYAFDPATSAVHFLSIGGSTSSVKGILAALAGGGSVQIHAGEIHRLSVPSWRKIRIYTVKLCRGCSHGILVADGEEGEDRLIVDASPARIFDYLYHAFPLTALPEWRHWLVEDLHDKGALRYLEGYRLRAALLWVTEAELDKTVKHGIARNHIRFERGTE